MLSDMTIVKPIVYADFDYELITTWTMTLRFALGHGSRFGKP